MAFDKLVDSAQLDAGMSATANAIREKTGGADPIVWEKETGFKSAVEEIPAGSTTHTVTLTVGTATGFASVLYEDETGTVKKIALSSGTSTTIVISGKCFAVFTFEKGYSSKDTTGVTLAIDSGSVMDAYYAYHYFRTYFFRCTGDTATVTIG